MKAAEIRRRFLDFFVARGHTLVPSSSLVPADDPTLLFVNAGMVQFKRTFLGQDPRLYTRATTCQKCVRAGGKHNDLEQVGSTRRHFTFFEMLGNFSFGDYFKRDAIAYAWEFITSPTGLDIHPDRLSVSILLGDAETRDLWLELTDIPADRIYALGEKENFWQMGDTGPCGPSSEIFVDLEWTAKRGAVVTSQADFEVLSETGRFVEFWNLVFMQFDRSADGTLTPLPKPSVDTGAGLDRISSVLQGYDDIFHSDVMRSLIDRVATLVGAPYSGGPEGTGISYRVLADHARSVAFLLLDGVYPGNDGRGFVLRRILRRGVRHAWLLGRREPTLALMIAEVVKLMGDAYPLLVEKEQSITDIVRQEEERFLTTIEAGLERLEGFFASGIKTIPGDEAFKLFDTFGFPIDLTELIAAERGVGVDSAGFDVSMNEQRQRSRDVQKAGKAGGKVTGGETRLTHSGSATFVGYDSLEVETVVLGDAEGAAAGMLVLRDSPFYATSGGQVADTGVVAGQGWSFAVADVRKDSQAGQVLLGQLTGTFLPGPVTARVDAVRRRDIERNHSATHLAHLVLRRRLGEHVRQQGSLVEPSRLRFDFSHGGPIDASQLAELEAEINELVLANDQADIRELPLDEALKLGAMAFFADKYGDRVRVVTIGNSIELCGGTHVRSAGEIGLFRFASQGGVAAGVRRIEAITGHGAYQSVVQFERRIAEIAALIKATPDQIERRVASLLAEREKLEARLAAAMKGGTTAAADEQTIDLNGVSLVVRSTVAEDRAQLGELADAFRGSRKVAAVLLMHNPTAPTALAMAVTDDLIARGKDANSLMKHVAAQFGGRGGGRPTFASGVLAVPDVEALLTTGLRQAVEGWLQG